MINDMAYVEGLMRMENGPLDQAPEGTRVMPNEAPEDDGGMDIGFGHKITKEERDAGEIYGIPFSQGISKEEAVMIAEADAIKHSQRAKAKIGNKVWNELPQAGRDLLTDYSVTGTLDKFPKMFKALSAKDMEGTIQEMERKFTQDGQLVPMETRNAFGMEMLNAMEGYWK